MRKMKMNLKKVELNTVEKIEPIKNQLQCYSDILPKQKKK